MSVRNNGKYPKPTYPPPPLRGLAPVLDRNIEALRQVGCRVTGRTRPLAYPLSTQQQLRLTPHICYCFELRCVTSGCSGHKTSSKTARLVLKPCSSGTSPSCGTDYPACGLAIFHCRCQNHRTNPRDRRWRTGYFAVCGRAHCAACLHRSCPLNSSQLPYRLLVSAR
jgi:hypothetical protein